MLVILQVPSPACEVDAATFEGPHLKSVGQVILKISRKNNFNDSW